MKLYEFVHRNSRQNYENCQNKYKYSFSVCVVPESLLLGVLKMISDEEYSISGTPPEIKEAANLATLHLLPQKSKEKYEFAYKRFMDYRQSKNADSYSENVVLAYFLDLSKKLKSSTLWANYSMVRSTLSVKHNVDISKYQKLRAFLKRQSDGYRAKKSKVLSEEHIQKFILEAPDDTFLTIKVRK